MLTKSSVTPGLGAPGIKSDTATSTYILAIPIRSILAGGLRNSDVALLSFLLDKAYEDGKHRHANAKINPEIMILACVLLRNKMCIGVVLCLFMLKTLSKRRIILTRASMTNECYST